MMLAVPTAHLVEIGRRMAVGIAIMDVTIPVAEVVVIVAIPLIVAVPVVLC
jgi:hypothetical protein